MIEKMKKKYFNFEYKNMINKSSFKINNIFIVHHLWNPIY